MRPILAIAVMDYGSHLYGTTVPGSDNDYMGVHLPSGRAILLGRPEDTLKQGTKADLPPSAGGIGSARIRATQPGEIDRESHSLGKLFGMLRGGHMVAVEMLFVPEARIREADPLWHEIRAERARLVSRNVRGFVGYARKQAEVYGRKATRFGEIQMAHDLIARAIAERGADAALHEIGDALDSLVTGRDHLGVVPLDSGHTLGLPHLVVAGKHIAYTHRLGVVQGIVEARLRRYGERARAAQEGTDWKSVSHAVRIAHQAIELLTTGTLSFPRPEAEALRAIRLGQRARPEVGAEIDALLEEVERRAPLSSLPEGPDEALMDEFQFRAYARQMTAR